MEAQLSKAETVLGEYVSRLEVEERERVDLQELLEVYVWQQRQQLREAKKKLRVSQELWLQELCDVPFFPLPAALSDKTGEGDGSEGGTDSEVGSTPRPLKAPHQFPRLPCPPPFSWGPLQLTPPSPHIPPPLRRDNHIAPLPSIWTHSPYQIFCHFLCISY